MNALPFHRLATLLLALLLAISVSGCTVKYVADYDSVAFEEILATAKKVDKFYGSLLESKADKRQYSQFADQYVNLQADIQGMVTRNHSRALNSESTEISQIILKLFTTYKDRHKKRDTYTDGNAELDRDRFVRLFGSAANAERAKNLTDDDKNPEKGSK